MIRSRRLAPPMILVALAVAAGPVLAQDTGSKHNSNAPIDWDADHLEVHDRDHKAILVGNVRAKQEEMTLTADRATAFYTGSLANSNGSGGSGPQINRLDANGHVVVTRPTEVAHGDYGIYDLDKKLITMIGHVVLDRTGQNAGTTRGGRLVIDLNTNQAKMDGSNVGGSGSAGSGGRVSGRFTVAKQGDQAGQKPASQTTAKPAGK
jgi:lipopolysaccharide export system protein LptA